jgi:TusA-related sulfurtransferase
METGPSEPRTWVDASNLACPLPIVRLALAVRGLKRGERAGVIATDPAVQSDLPAWCEATGNALVSLREDGARWVGVVERG